MGLSCFGKNCGIAALHGGSYRDGMSFESEFAGLVSRLGGDDGVAGVGNDGRTALPPLDCGSSPQ